MPRNIKAFAKGTSRIRRRPQPDATGVVSCWLEFPLTRLKVLPTILKEGSLVYLPLCRAGITEDQELTRVVSQFIEANRAPKLVEKDF